MSKKLSAVGALLICAVAVFEIIENVAIPGHTYFWREIHNLGHTPLFGVVAVVILQLSKLFFTMPKERYPRHYVVAFVIACGMGLLSEVVQRYTPRDADIMDFLRDVLGATSFLGIWSVFDKGMRPTWQRLGKAKRKAVFYLSVFILLAALTPLGLWAAAYIHRSDMYPKLLSFESPLENKFIKTRNAEWKRVDAPEGWGKTEDRRVGKITFDTGELPTFCLREPYPDWVSKRYLKFEVYSESDSSISIAMRIEDRYHDHQYSDRFNRKLEIQPGLNHISIPIEQIRRAPETRRMAIYSIRDVCLFTAGLDRPLTLYVDDFRLE